MNKIIKLISKYIVDEAYKKERGYSWARFYKPENIKKKRL